MTEQMQDGFEQSPLQKRVIKLLEVACRVEEIRLHKPLTGASNRRLLEAGEMIDEIIAEMHEDKEVKMAEQMQSIVSIVKRRIEFLREKADESRIETSCLWTQRRLEAELILNTILCEEAGLE